jgi:MoaA/NifB/PqqE/SkfB family radical SAM enzyme
MTCEENQERWRQKMRRQAGRDNVPLSGVLELTRRCNFRCAHCYAGPALRADGEMDTATWQLLMDEAAEAGCLGLVLTGGEPLLRPDFATLHTHARKRGMEVTVFTNAVLVDEAVANLFHEWPPREVEVTVYGLTEDVTRRVTGVSGGCARQWDGIRRLVDRAIPVTVKVLATKEIRDEIDGIEARAREWGLRFRVSAEVTARRDGDPAPLAHRLPPEEAARLDEKEAGWSEAIKERFASRHDSSRRYPCAAGQYGFFVDAEGGIQPCMPLRRFRQPYRPGHFREIWMEVRDAARGQQRAVDNKGVTSLIYDTCICIGLTDWSADNPDAMGWDQALAKERIRKMDMSLLSK